MGLFKRKGSAFWYLWLDGQHPARVNTKVPIDGGTPRQTARNRQLAVEMYQTRMAAVARQKILNGLNNGVRVLPIAQPPIERSLAGWCYVYFGQQYSCLTTLGGPEYQKSWLPRGFEFLSGFPERIRRRRIILTLQAIFDDSGTKGTGRFMAMAGLFGPADSIAAIADDWDKHLRANSPGAIRYFKMADAVPLVGEFKHWREDNRNAKIVQMAKVINREEVLEISATLDLDAFGDVFKDWDGGSRTHHAFSQPYIMLSQFVLAAAVTESLNRGSTKPLEIIYDNHDVFKPVIIENYEMLRHVVGENDPARLGVMPIQPWFRDDREFVMLQAADLLAGEARLSAEHDDLIATLGDLCPKLKASGTFKMIDESAMLRFRDGKKAEDS